jgi:hypothetical protein
VRGLAALPVQPLMADTGPLQLVRLEDVVQTIVFFLQPGPPSRQVIELVGPRTWSFSDFVRLRSIVATGRLAGRTALAAIRDALAALAPARIAA